MEYIIVALLVGTLAVVLWGVISIRRLARGLVGVRDSQCEQAYRACIRSCEELVQTLIIREGVRLDPGVSQCFTERVHSFLTCAFKPDQAAREECFREAERKFQECLAQQNALSVDVLGSVSVNPCHVKRTMAFLACSFEPDLAAREECLREAERKFQDCLMQQNPAYGACMRGCLEKRIDCHRKILQDPTLGRREELPSKPELPLEPPIPPMSPRP
jgi:hypothetical protein